MITFIELNCPQCNKRRMLRPEGYVVNERKAKKELPSGDIVEHFVDVCNQCVNRLRKLYYTPKKGDAKKVLQALDSGTSLGDKSIEELL